MSRISRQMLLAIAATWLCAGCEKVREVVCAPEKGSAADAASKQAGAAGAPSTKDEKQESRQAAPHEQNAESAPQERVLSAGSQSAYALPFAWQKSPNEPLARARTYIREVADDNTVYMAKGPDFFRAFAESQKPRATVIACADSRVQSGAYDASPENDDFTIRNIGNQVGTSLGSVQYGIDHLHTPVLMIIGHTGCGAVKAALQNKDELPTAIRKEIDQLHVHVTSGKGVTEDRKWLNAVIENIHDQVKEALRIFGARVNAGDLTIIGAIYDFRNDLAKGHGRLAVIDVNGVDDPGRLKSFVEAIMSGESRGSTQDPFSRLARALADPGPEGADEEEDQVVSH